MHSCLPQNKNDRPFFVKPDFSKANNGLYLKKFVVLGYTDIMAAGSRALLGLSMRKEYFDLDIPELGKACPSCVRDAPPEVKEQNFLPLQILHCKYEQFSFIVINTEVPAGKCHNVADKIMDLCVKSKVERLVVLTTTRLETQIPDTDIKPMYEVTFNTEPVFKTPALTQDIKLCDAFLSTIIQMVQIEGIPCNCLIAPGSRAMSGKANEYDGSQQTIQKFHKLLSKWSNLNFDEDLSMSLIYESSEELDTARMASLMYV